MKRLDERGWIPKWEEEKQSQKHTNLPIHEPTYHIHSSNYIMVLELVDRLALTGTHGAKELDVRPSETPTCYYVS
jgi:hypothetical protein